MDARLSDSLSRQRELYGAPVGESVRRVVDVLGLSQAAVARTIGVSPPMLSQVVSGHRVKFGNALAVQRLQSLLGLADDVESGLPFEAVGDRLDEIGREDSTTLTGHRSAAVRADLPEAFGNLLRAVASGRELLAAAERLQESCPDLAEVIRVYGTGSAAEAHEHFDKVAPLI